MTTRSRILSALISLILLGCGVGGGKGGDDSEEIAASVDVDANPSTLDTGDRMTITVYIDEVSDSGVMLKIRTPAGLSYVTDTGFLAVDDQSFDLTPTVNKGDGTYNYLIYFLSRGLFGESNQGVLTVTYNATAATGETAAAVEVDPDFDNPDLADDAQFVIETPNFSAETSKTIKVTG